MWLLLLLLLLLEILAELESILWSIFPDAAGLTKLAKETWILIEHAHTSTFPSGCSVFGARFQRFCAALRVVLKDKMNYISYYRCTISQ